MSEPKLSHVDAAGVVRMVDVSDKEVTRRRATASGIVTMGEAAFAQVSAGAIKKGDVLTTARIAGIQAAKRTAELIPLCHGLSSDHVEVTLTLEPPGRVRITAETTCMGRTGVEMEALTAVSVAALTVYDMCKAVSKAIEIGPIRLESKSGGRSGDWRRDG